MKQLKILETAPNIQSIQSFFQRFEKEERRLQSYKIERDHTALSGFLRNFGSFERLAFQFRAQSATYFDVFQVLRLGHYEERLHTPFLAHLLDPAGAHSQGRLFFDAFLSMVLPADAIPPGISHIEVSPEHHTPYGRIDILVKYRVRERQSDVGKLQAVVIENKVYAPDQPRQLERYHNYLTKTLGLKTGEFHLIYLSPWKQQPSIEKEGEEDLWCSITERQYNALKASKSLLEIGYYAEIVPWLEGCIEQIQAPVVAHTVKQYLKTIQRL